MSKTKRSWTFLLALAMLLSLCACGKQEGEEQPEMVVIGQPQVSSQTEPGYVTTELPMRSGYQDFGGLQSCGNSLGRQTAASPSFAMTPSPGNGRVGPSTLARPTTRRSTPFPQLTVLFGSG